MRSHRRAERYKEWLISITVLAIALVLASACTSAAPTPTAPRAPGLPYFPFPGDSSRWVGLVLYLALGEGEQPLFILPTPEVALSSRWIEMEGAPTLLATGREPGDRPYHRLSWNTGGYQYALITPYPVAELLRIARSLGPTGVSLPSRTGQHQLY